MGFVIRAVSITHRVNCPSAQAWDGNKTHVTSELTLPSYGLFSKPFIISVLTADLSPWVSWTLFLEKELSTFSFLYCEQGRKLHLKHTKDPIVPFSAVCGTGVRGRRFSCYAQPSGQWPKSLALAVPFLLKGRILQGGEKTITGSNLRILRNSLRLTMSGLTEYRLYWTENLIFFVRFLPIHHGLCSEPAGVHYAGLGLRMKEG